MKRLGHKGEGAQGSPPCKGADSLPPLRRGGASRGAIRNLPCQPLLTGAFSNCDPATPPRRGVTLVEMLVVVALLVLMMTIIVQIFQAATGAVSAAKVYQELDDQLRELDGTLRQDLAGVTARLNPPLDPDENKGYFEYGENSFADLQGEDTDDYLKFTAQAPEGQSFTGACIYSNPRRIRVFPQRW